MEKRRSCLPFAFISAIIALALSIAFSIATGLSAFASLSLAACASAVGFILGIILYIEHYYGKNSEYFQERQQAIEKRMQLILGHIASSDILSGCRTERGENSVTVFICDDSALYFAFSITLAQDSTVVFNAAMHDFFTGRNVRRELALANVDDDDLYHCALRHLSDPAFIYTLAPLSREVKA